MNRHDLQKLAEAYTNVHEGTMDIKGFEIPEKEREAAAKRVKEKTAAKKKKNVRGYDSEEQKKRLEKKRGMKLDDHPQFKKEEVEDIEEADSLAAMAARREKRLKAQRKREGTTATGQDFGHDHGISDAERKKRQKAEFDAFIGRGKKKTNEELELEGYKGKHGQSDKEYADSRSQGGKMVSGDSKMSGAEYTHGRRVKAANPGMQPDVGGKTKPKSQGKMDKGTRADLTFRKAALRKEELEGNPVYEATKKDIKEFVGSAIQGAVNSAGQALATPVGAGLAAGTVGAVTGGKKKVKKSLATGAGAAAGAALGGLPGAVIGGIAGNALS